MGVLKLSEMVKIVPRIEESREKVSFVADIIREKHNTIFEERKDFGQRKNYIMRDLWSEN
jgi:hypothetical protein